MLSSGLILSRLAVITRLSLKFDPRIKRIHEQENEARKAKERSLQVNSRCSSEKRHGKRRKGSLSPRRSGKQKWRRYVAFEPLS